MGEGQGPSMRAWMLYGAAVVVRVTTLLWMMVQLPDRVATHFNASGAADGWSSRGGYLAFDVVLSAVLVLGLPMLVTPILAGSGAALNIPHKDYWLRPENRPRLRRRLTADMLFYASTIGLLLSWVDVEVVRANTLATPSMGASAVVATGVFLVVVLAYTAWIATRGYAVPREARS